YAQITPTSAIPSTSNTLLLNGVQNTLPTIPASNINSSPATTYSTIPSSLSPSITSVPQRRTSVVQVQESSTFSSGLQRRASAISLQEPSTILLRDPTSTQIPIIRKGSISAPASTPFYMSQQPQQQHLH